MGSYKAQPVNKHKQLVQQPQSTIMLKFNFIFDLKVKELRAVSVRTI